MLVVAGAVVAMAVPVVQGKTEEPKYTIENSVQAVRQARDADAGRWAPSVLEQAESALRAGQLDARLQKIKFLPFRDYTTTRFHIARADSLAKLAVAETFRLRQEALEASTAAIEDAARHVGTTDSFANSVHLNTYERSILQKAKINLAEAQILHDKGEYLDSKASAEEAVERALRIGDRVASVVARYSDETLVRKWRGWIEDTVAASRRSGGDAVIVNKERHTLTLYNGGREVKTYRVELGYNSVRDKHHAGDNATPEGRYRITDVKGVGQSKYHRAFLLNYPNEDDRAEFARMKKAGQLPKGVGLGGLIEIHGEGGQGKDWTMGCVAMRNSEIDDLARHIGSGCPITIVGGDGSGGIYTDMLHERKLLSASSKSDPETPTN